MCLSDTKAVEGVLFGPGGVEQVLTAGMIIADLEYDFAVRHATFCRAREGAGR